MKLAKDASGPKSSGTAANGLMTRWSVKKAPNHDAVRQRDNQRRHRERVKGYITKLEGKVQSQETELSQAYQRIEELVREVQVLKKLSACGNSPPCSSAPMSQATTTQPTNEVLAEDDAQAQRPGDVTLHPGDNMVPQCYRRGSCDPSGADVSDCEDLPPPGAGESTTGCRAAFKILEQQSTDPLDIGAVEQFLRPGYRRALQRGDGCRVDSHLFFGLLDKITP